VSFPLLGRNATVNSWGSTNLYSTILAAITPASARYTLRNNGQNITGIGSFAMSQIAGLCSADVTIGGYAGSAPYLGVYGSVAAGGSPSGASTPYVTSPQSLTITLETTGVHDITTGSTGSPATYMSFMPDGFQARASWTALVDSSTALSGPDLRTTTTYNQLAFTYANGGTVTFPACNIQTTDVQLVRGNKQLVTYQAESNGGISASGGIFGTQASWGTSTNPFPLSSLGGSAAGALVLYLISGGAKSISFADSFIRSMSITATPSAPVAVTMAVRPTGSWTIT